MNSQEAIDYAHKYRAKMVDLKFTDLLGTWQHLTIPGFTTQKRNF